MATHVDWSGTNVLAFMGECLTKMENEAAYIRLGKRKYLDALVHTSLLSGKRARLSAQMRVHTASSSET